MCGKVWDELFNYPREGVPIKTLFFQSSKLVSAGKGIQLWNLLQYFIMVELRINHNCVNGARVFDESSAHDRADINSQHCQITNLQSGTKYAEEKFKLRSFNVGRMRGRTGKVVKTSLRRKVDLCLVQEIS